MKRLSIGLGALSVLLGVVVWTLGREVAALRERIDMSEREFATCQLERARQSNPGMNTGGRATDLRAIQTPTIPQRNGLSKPQQPRKRFPQGMSAANAQTASKNAVDRWKAEHSPQPNTFTGVRSTIDAWFLEVAEIEKSYKGGLIDEGSANADLLEARSRYERDLQGVLGTDQFKPFWRETRLGDLYPRVPTAD